MRFLSWLTPALQRSATWNLPVGGIADGGVSAAPVISACRRGHHFGSPLPLDALYIVLPLVLVNRAKRFPVLVEAGVVLVKHIEIVY